MLFICKLKRIFRLPLLNVENSFKVAMVYKFLFMAFMGYMVIHKYMENNHFDINIRLCYWYLLEIVCSWNWCEVGIFKLFMGQFQRESVHPKCFDHFFSENKMFTSILFGGNSLHQTFMIVTLTLFHRVCTVINIGK